MDITNKYGAIYMYTNKINGKAYIGQTCRLRYRQKEHEYDALKGDSEYPFHRAIRKYGYENFDFKIIEDNIPIDELNEKEQYYINKYNTYHHGYNACLGGDGVLMYKYDEVSRDFLKSGLSLRAYAKKTKITRKTLIAILESCNLLEYYKEKHPDRFSEAPVKPVYMKDKKTKEVINMFESMEEAYRYLGKGSNTAIKKVCEGIQSHAYNYLWSYVEA